YSKRPHDSLAPDKPTPTAPDGDAGIVEHEKCLWITTAPKPLRSRFKSVLTRPRHKASCRSRHLPRCERIIRSPRRRGRHRTLLLPATPRIAVAVIIMPTPVIRPISSTDDNNADDNNVDGSNVDGSDNTLE